MEPSMTTGQPSSPFLAFLLRQRAQVAVGLAAVGVLLTALTILWGVWGARADVAAPVNAEGKLKVEAPEPDEKPAEAKTARSPDYRIAAFIAGLVALLALCAAAWLFTQVPDPAAPELAVRKEVLAVGGLAGFFLVLGGILFGVVWHRSLRLWLNGAADEGQWVFYAASLFIAGLLVMFASLSLARAEQRTNAGLRRLLYGFNAVFVGLLLALVLVVVNIVSVKRLPETLVANDSAFTELAPESKAFLRQLDTPVHVYLIMGENHTVELTSRHTYSTLYTDCRGFLSECEDESPHFKVTYLSPAFDDKRIPELMKRLDVNPADRDQFGMLVVVGANEESKTFIRAEELIGAESRDLVFQGENKLLTELMYLTDARAREKVYFTQGHGELALEPGGDGKSMASMAGYLRDKRLTVEPLTFEGATAKVPDDAAVVVVAGLRRTLAADDPMQLALREYLKRPKPGKLLLCLPAFRDVQGKVGPTGLEPLLAEYGLELDGTRRLLAQPGTVPLGQGMVATSDYVLAQPLEGIGDLERIVGDTLLVLQDPRPIRINPSAMPGVPRPVPLMATSAITWQETDFTGDLRLLWDEIQRDPKVRQEKMATGRPMPLAYAVTQPPPQGQRGPGKPSLLVFASDTFLEDKPRIAGPAEFRQQAFGNSIEWLRERDASINIPPRKVNVFALPKPIGLGSQAALLAMMTIGIAVLGGGVWLSRRR